VIVGVVAMGAGIFTGSVSLVAFGADSFIEVISAVALPLSQRSLVPRVERYPVTI
jgi:divalent metal cation (Fe/Co/Zn/Cd) transporter